MRAFLRMRARYPEAVRILVALLVVAGLWAALAWLAHRSAFFPMRHPQGWWSVQRDLGAEDVWLTARDGVKLHAWWLEAPEARAVTLFLHGNAGNVTHRGAAMREIVGAGSSVLLLDYRGYGKSGGTPSEGGLYRDADAAYDWLIGRGVRADRIVLHGESLGTAVAVDLAARRPCRALVLEAPFPSARAVAGSVLPGIGPLVMWGFDSKSKIAAVHVPLLVIQGESDEVIDIALGRELFAAAKEPKTFWALPRGGHNNIVEAAGPEYRKRLREFYGAR